MTVYDLVAEQIKKHPDSDAIIFNNKKIKYSELGIAIDKLASFLIRNGVCENEIVGISLNRSVEIIYAILAIAKVGSAYLPLDPSFPANRLAFMLNDSESKFLITEKGSFSVFENYKGKVLNIEDYKNSTVENFTPIEQSNSRAYILYTSGSTGNPKGVQITHRSLINFLLSMKENPGFTSSDVLLAVTTISFDISGLELYLPLICGGTVEIATKEEIGDGRLLLEKLKNVSVFQATPATYKLLIESGWNTKLKLKALCGGEPLNRDLANKILDRVDVLWNMYGPTETTIWSSCSKVEKDEIIHLGKPIRNTQLYVVDEHNNFCAIGVPGELLIGGEGLSIGYLNNNNLTSQKFIKNPFDKTGNSNVYKTGDLVKINSNYQIEFLGRIDNQVKIRGFRIELGEIENKLNQIGSIKDSVVVAKQFPNDDKKLAAYCTLAANNNYYDSENKLALIKDLKNNLSTQLPDYMIPSYFIFVDSFPLTPNGKIDRKKLEEQEIKNDLSNNKKTLPPRNATDEIFLNIWKKVLNNDNISIDDNFFEIGGHSILAAQLFTEFERATGLKIPLATLFKFQTIKEIVDSIQSDFYKIGWSPLVEIKKGKTDKNLFLVHGAEGNVLLYKELAKYLDEDYSVFGLQSRGLNGNGYIPNSIEEMAADYIEAIKNVQPAGSYNIGGYCMGGSIAFEIAQQLTRSGSKVLNLFLIETYNECLNKNAVHPDSKFENIKFHLDNLKRIHAGDKLKFINQKAQVTKRRVIARINSVYDKFGIDTKETDGASKLTFKVRDINDKAQVDYVPEPYTGKAILLRPFVSYSSEPDPDFGWRDLVKGEFVVYNLDLAPRGMLVEPFVKETAVIISKELNEKGVKQRA